MKAKPKFTLETKLVASVKFYEELHVIRDSKGEMIFTGSPELARKILKLLKGARK